jgi:hypothetical protein
MKRWVGALAGLALLAGCGSPTSATPPAPRTPLAVADPHSSWDVSSFPDPCRTITDTELSAIVGTTVKPGTVLDSWPPLCQFVVDPQKRTYVYVSDDSGSNGKPDYDRKRVMSSLTQPVDGIGDEAYWQPDLGQLHVLSKNTHVFVAFAGAPVPDGAKEKALAMARLVLPRTAV